VKQKVRAILVHGLIVSSFAVVFFHNVVFPAGVAQSLIAPKSRLILNLRSWAIQHDLFVLTRVTGTCTTWRMYSPTWRFFLWHDWYAQDPKGQWVPLEIPNLSPAYWLRRSWFKKWFWDCKESALEYHVSSLSEYRDAMVRYLCRETAEEYGWKPQAIRLARKDKFIPPPERRGTWSPLTGPVDRQFQSDFACS